MTQTFADRIEKLKSDYTDKYVVADATRTELRRFSGLTGQVRTVNMSGRALVEFEGNNNIGWFDIELDYLKVVDKPVPPLAEAKAKAAPAKKKPAAQPAAEKGLSPLELARMQGPAKKSGDSGNGPADRKSKTADMLAAARVKKGSAAPTAKPAGKMSTADILAAARGDAAAPAAEPKPPATKPAAKAADPKAMSTADILAAARGKAAPAAPAPSKPAKPAGQAKPAAPQADPKKMSTADILAAARGQAPASAPETPAAAAPAEETTITPKDQPTTPAKPDAAASAGPLPTDTAGIIAWCREHDAK